MSQLLTYTSAKDGASSRRYSGYPLNSTLVSSYTPDTIRSIISHAAAGQPYSTAVWIRINRVGIQVGAQDPQIARTRVPVFIPVGLVHDIYMLPNINNVICIVYDEIQSNMKGVLLYVVHPTDAQLLRDDFRIVKQANNNQQLPPGPYSSPFENRLSQAGDIISPGTNRPHQPGTTPTKSPLANDLYRNTVTIRQTSPKRAVPVRDGDTTSITPEIGYAPSKSSNHNGKEDSSHRRNKSPKRNTSGNPSTKRSIDNGTKQQKHRSRSPEKQGKTKLPTTNSSHELSQEQIRQQQEQLLLQQQQQQWAIQQQQQMAAWQASQQASMVPIGIYNRYVPKTIPLPTGETLKTALPAVTATGGSTNGVAVAYIEPQIQPTANTKLSGTTSPRLSSNQNTTTNTHSTRPQQRRQLSNDSKDPSSKLDPNPTTTQSVRSRSKHSSVKETSKSVDTDDETKQYLKLLIEEMQAMKMEMNRMRQTSLGGTKGRSDSLQGDLKEIRSHIDLIRARMALTPKIPEHRN